ncbi:MAG: hypothetical protein IT244_12720 [Bacteroidia bacterium]|nr:hypothetical protein [Bacteroidia bacterium]
MNFKKYLFLAACSTLSYNLLAQSSGQNYTISPYSNFGLGEVLNTNLAQAGYLSQTYTGAYSYSFLNPATLGNLKYTSLDFGLNARYGVIETQGQSRSFQGGSLSYLSLAFKTMRRYIPQFSDSAGTKKRTGTFPISWNSYFSIYPSTSVGYNYTVENTTPFLTRVSHSGKGGVNTVEFGNAFGFGKHINVGYSGAFLIGQITDRSLVSAPDSADLYIIDDDRTANIRGYKHQVGVMLRLGSDSAKHTFGASYRFYSGVKASNQRLTQVFGLTATGYTQPDTVLNIEGSYQKISMPAGFGFGYNFSFRNKIAIGLDYYRENWANYTSYFQSSQKLANRSDYGLSFTLNPLDEKPNKSKKMPLPVRFGLRYSQTQNVFTKSGSNVNITENAAYFGFGLPITRRYFDNTVIRSMLNVRFDYVNRGTLNSGLAKEQYLITTLSFNLGDVWFQRRKFD